MGIFTLLALIFLVVCILAGKAALPGNPVLLVRKCLFKTLGAVVWTDKVC